MEINNKRYIMPVPGEQEPVGDLERIFLTDDSDVYDAVAEPYTAIDLRFQTLYPSMNIDAVQEADLWWKVIYDDVTTIEIDELREEYARLSGEEYYVRPYTRIEKENVEKVLLNDDLENETATDYVGEMDFLIREACQRISDELRLGKLAILEVIDASDAEYENLEDETCYAYQILARIEENLREKIAAIKQADKDAFRSDARDYGHDTAMALAEDRARTKMMARK